MHDRARAFAAVRAITAHALIPTTGRGGGFRWFVGVNCHAFTCTLKEKLGAAATRVASLA